MKKPKKIIETMETHTQCSRCGTPSLTQKEGELCCKCLRGRVKPRKPFCPGKILIVNPGYWNARLNEE